LTADRRIKAITRGRWGGNGQTPAWAAGTTKSLECVAENASGTKSLRLLKSQTVLVAGDPALAWPLTRQSMPIGEPSASRPTPAGSLVRIAARRVASTGATVAVKAPAAREAPDFSLRSPRRRDRNNLDGSSRRFVARRPSRRPR
jgi:hypothetical protein